MKDRSGLYPPLTVDDRGRKVVSGAGGVLLTRTAATVGLDAALSAALRPWRKPLARHDPGKVLLDLAISLAIGGDCLADVAQLRAHPEVFGAVASDPTVSRLVDALAVDAPAALAAINSARATSRARAWTLAGKDAPDHRRDASRPLVIDVDATLVTAHSEKQHAAPTFKRGFGFHPLWAFCDHGAEGTGEPLAFVLRRGNAGSNTVADHIDDRPHRRAPGRTRPTPRCQRSAREERADPSRRRRRHPWADRLADSPTVGVLGRVQPARHPRGDPDQARLHPEEGLVAGLRRRR